MAERVQVGGLSVASVLHRFVQDEALPGSGVDPERFWGQVEAILTDLSPRNQALLARRDALQSLIDAYHEQHAAAPVEPVDYEAFLREIGYLVEEPADFTIGTTGVDIEVASQAGPQLVVPLLNARFAINAANARWGSLYDALYGTDVIPNEGELVRGTAYNPVRGAAVVAHGRALLDAHFPLLAGSHADASGYALNIDGLAVTVNDRVTHLADPAQLVGYRGDRDDLIAFVMVHHGLHVEVLLDRADRVGAADGAGVKDLLLEAAVSTIMDLEDSVSAVDAEDKVLGYRNWLGLMQGTLTEVVHKDDETFVRRMNPDRTYTSPSGEPVTLPGRALMFVRQVGHLMTTDAILDRDGNEVPEGIVDALMAGLGSLHDLRGHGELRNSRTGSVYIVKPKMHGPDEVAFTDELFGRVERALGLPPLTLKIGIMDEERRTTVNLKACLYAARDRVAFINTGFLDRTGDEIHTSMRVGPVVRKADMRSQAWIRAYEDNNVDVGLACGLQGRAQIGKGMWAAPDSLAAMLDKKVEHPLAGATCAWVPSPTAATLHALHYHQVDVQQRQRDLTGGRRTTLAQLLTIPVGDGSAWSAQDRQAEVDNNLQGVLGYVVRWVDAGVGCSKVPDIHGEALMEDRATCRISSQHVANWLLHGIVTTEQVEQTLRRMALVVDAQNADDATYVPMAPTFDGEGFLAARELVLHGLQQPNGYTELVLHRRRQNAKALARKG